MEPTEDTSYMLRSRSRSRSQTPLILEDLDDYEQQRYNLRSLSREGSQAPSLMSSTSSNKSYTRTTRSMSSALKGKKFSLDIIDENKDDNSDSLSKKSDSSITIKKPEKKSSKYKLKKQNGSNLENINLNPACESNTPKQLMTSDYSSEEGDSETARPTSAYEFYKQQGDWWNKFPKTDYTYSPASTCRYEVAPGIMAIPNMSRRSLRSNDNSLNSSQETISQTQIISDSDTISATSGLADISGGKSSVSDTWKEINNSNIFNKKSLSQEYSENFINHSFQRIAYSTQLKFSMNHSNNTVDLQDLQDKISKDIELNSTSQMCFNNFTSLISKIFYLFMYAVTIGYYDNKYSTSHIHHGYIQKASKWQTFMDYIDNFMNFIYLGLAKILLLDAWLLSKFSSVRRKFQNCGSKIFWLSVLPLLSAAGFWVILYTFSRLPFKISYQTINKQMITDNEYGKLNPFIEDYNNYLKNMKNNLMEQSNNLNAVTQEMKHITSQFESEKKRIENIELKLHDITQEIYNLQIKSSCPDSPEEKVEKLLFNYFGKDFSKQDILKIFQTIKVLNQNDFSILNVHERNLDGINKNSMKEMFKEIIKEEVDQMIDRKLQLYDADRTGKADFALESAGGQVISTRCTQHYNIHTRAIKILGFTIYSESNNPRTVIQGNNLQPGICWAFQGFPGTLLVKLRSLIHITGFTIEHAHKENLPEGAMKSAPKNFNVWGFLSESDRNPVLFGEYEFLDSSNLQYFSVQNDSITTPFEFVELRIFSNHGRMEYTCLYRFRVHGRLAEDA